MDGLERQTLLFVIDEQQTNKDRIPHGRIRATDNKKYQNLDRGWRMNWLKKVRPWRPGQIWGCFWRSKSVIICVGVWLFMTSNSSKNFFDIRAWAVTAQKIGSAPQKIDLFDFLVSRTVFTSKKTSEKNKKSWANVSFKKWAFMILSDSEFFRSPAPSENCISEQYLMKSISNLSFVTDFAHMIDVINLLIDVINLLLLPPLRPHGPSHYL